MSKTIPQNPAAVAHVKIRADDGRVQLNLHELADHWDLIFTLAARDVKVRYKQTVLGVVWVVLQPLLTALIFAFVFGMVAGLSANGQPYVVFAFAGVMTWTLFSNVLSRSSMAIVGNSHLVSKVYFPRLILPLSSALATLLDFAVVMVVMVALLLVNRIMPGYRFLLLPVWLSILLLLALGLGLIAGGLMVSYRDVQYIIPVLLTLGLYASPVAWSVLVVPEHVRWVFRINPLTGLLEAFRWSLLGQGTLDWPALAFSTVSAVAAFWAGTIVFARMERRFADVI